MATDLRDLTATELDDLIRTTTRMNIYRAAVAERNRRDAARVARLTPGQA